MTSWPPGGSPISASAGYWCRIGAENSILGYLPASGTVLQIEPHLVIHGVMMELLRQASAGFVSSSNLPSILFLFLIVTVRLQRSFLWVSFRVLGFCCFHGLRMGC